MNVYLETPAAVVERELAAWRAEEQAYTEQCQRIAAARLEIRRLYDQAFTPAERLPIPRMTWRDLLSALLQKG